jgi:hypothetical protein
MIQIPLGNEFIETESITKFELEALAGSQEARFLIVLLKEQADKSVLRLREHIEDGDLNSAIAEQATAKTFEQLSVMLEIGIHTALKSGEV